MQNNRVPVGGGKLYTKVVDRLTAFKEKYHPDKGYYIETAIHTLTDNYVIFKATIFDNDENVLSTGHGFNAIAKEKAFEKAETVAVGRALAFFDPMYGGESELASQEEMEKFKELTADKPIPVSKDDGSHFLQTQPKPVVNGVLGLAEQAKKQMTNGTSNGTTDEITMPFGKHKGTPISELDIQYIEWALGHLDNLDGKLHNAMTKRFHAEKAGS